MNKSLELILLGVSKSPAIDEGSIENASRLILDSICEGLAISRAGIWLLDHESANISCVMLIDKGHDLDHESLKLSRSDFPNYFAALDTERTIAADDANSHQATAEFSQVYLVPLGINSMLDVPIRHQGKMIGIVCCEHRGKPRAWQPEEMVFAASLADLYGRAVSAKQRNDYEQQLVLANQTLEQKVKVRTNDLEQALASLQDAQTKLVDSEKMAALGNLVAGVSHEVNTPLGIALTSVSHCAEELTKVSKAFQNDQLTERGFKSYVDTCSEGLAMAQDNLNRAARLIHDFKRSAADQISMGQEQIDLGEYLSQIINPLSPMLRKECISLELNLPRGHFVYTCPGCIAQLVTNLISNVQRHAFPEGFQSDTQQLMVKCGESEKGLYFSVADNGIGIDKSLHNKVFEPFYTTARERGGTGLGLPIFFNLVTQKLNGEVSFDSEPGKGTNVTIWLPEASKVSCE